MSKRAGKLYPPEIMEKVRHDFMFGKKLNKATALVEYYTIGELSAKYDIPYGTIGSWAGRASPPWKHERDMLEAEAVSIMRKKGNAFGLKERAALLKEEVMLLEAQKGSYAKALKEGRVTVSTRDVQQALKRLDELSEKVCGVEDEPAHGIINIKMDVMSDDDRDALYESAARIRSIANRFENGDVTVATEDKG